MLFLHWKLTSLYQIRFPLVIASRYNIPFLLDHPDHGNNVRGEIYRVDEQKVKHLDILEDYPKVKEQIRNKYLSKLTNLEHHAVLLPPHGADPGFVPCFLGQ